jgi:hypothetical protein
MVEGVYSEMLDEVVQLSCTEEVARLNDLMLPISYPRELISNKNAK